MLFRSSIGKHCFSPYPCDFLGTCWQNVKHENSVFNIGKTDRDKLFEWYNSGISITNNIKNLYEQKPHVQIQINSINTKEEYIDKEAINDFINKIEPPFGFLDMEIWGPAIPKYAGTKPFEQIPFLFSLCYGGKNVSEFINYLKPIEEDGREEFLKELLKACLRSEERRVGKECRL